jgi:hypothetical protein
VGELVGVYVAPAEGFVVLAFTARITGEVTARGEILDVGWFDPHDPPSPRRTIADAVLADIAAGRTCVYHEV